MSGCGPKISWIQRYRSEITCGMMVRAQAKNVFEDVGAIVRLTEWLDVMPLRVA